jgi:hypothetical protein
MAHSAFMSDEKGPDDEGPKRLRPAGKAVFALLRCNTGGARTGAPAPKVANSLSGSWTHRYFCYVA